MIQLLTALSPIGCILVLSEILWRKKIVKGERARKFIHILAGVWMAFWPFYLPFDGILILGCVALTLLLYSRITKLFHAIYAVKRRTYGDILYALAIILCSVVTQEPWIFTTAILMVAIADGGAAVVGRFWGISNQYLVFGVKNLRKSIAGTTAFIMFTYLSLLVGYSIGGGEVMRENILIVFLLLPISATMLENIAPFGTDNLVTPLFVTLLLSSLV